MRNWIFERKEQSFAEDYAAERFEFSGCRGSPEVSRTLHERDPREIVEYDASSRCAIVSTRQHLGSGGTASSVKDVWYNIEIEDLGDLAEVNDLLRKFGRPEQTAYGVNYYEIAGFLIRLIKTGQMKPGEWLNPSWTDTDIARRMMGIREGQKPTDDRATEVNSRLKFVGRYRSFMMTVLKLPQKQQDLFRAVIFREVKRQILTPL